MKRPATTGRLTPLTATRQKAQRRALGTTKLTLTKKEVALLEDAIENELDEAQPAVVERMLERIRTKLGKTKRDAAALREAAALVEQLAADLDRDGDSGIEVSALRMAADMLDAASYVESAGGCS